MVNRCLQFEILHWNRHRYSFWKINNTNIKYVVSNRHNWMSHCKYFCNLCDVLKISVIWNVMSCSLVPRYKCFRGICCLHLHSTAEAMGTISQTTLCSQKTVILTLQSPVVTSYITMFNIVLLPTQCIYVDLQTAIISLGSIDWLVFVSDTVYCSYDLNL
jgi:hypothetical protein